MKRRSGAALLGRQSSIVFCGLSLSIGLGIVLQAYLAEHLGTSRLADVFFLGTALPTLIATATLGSTSNALIGYATESPRTLDPRIGGSTGRVLLLASLAVSAAVAGVGLLFLSGALRYSSDAASRDLAMFLLLTSPVPVLVTGAALGSVLALAARQFVRATWGGAVNGMGLLAIVATFGLGDLTSAKLALAVDLGYLAQLLFVLPALLRVDSLAATLDPAISRAATRGVFLLLGAAAVYKSQPLVERAAGTVVGSGVPAALGYADKIVQGFTLLAVFGFALASLPALSQDMAAGDHARATDKLRATFTATFTATLAVLAFAITSSGDIVRVLYEHGSFSAASGSLTQTLITFALPCVFFGALSSPLVAVVYANKRVGEVVRIGIQAFALGTTTTLVLAYAVGARGIVVGTGVGFAYSFARFAGRMRASLPDWSWRTYVADYYPRALATLGAVLVSMAVMWSVPIPQSAPTSVELLLIGARLLLAALAAFGSLFVVTRRRRPVRAEPHSSLASGQPR